MKKALVFSLMSMATVAPIAQATQVLNGYWAYQEFLDQFPEQKQLTNALLTPCERLLFRLKETKSVR